MNVDSLVLVNVSSMAIATVAGLVLLRVALLNRDQDASYQRAVIPIRVREEP